MKDEKKIRKGLTTELERYNAQSPPASAEHTAVLEEKLPPEPTKLVSLEARRARGKRIDREVEKVHGLVDDVRETLEEIEKSARYDPEAALIAVKEGVRHMAKLQKKLEEVEKL